MDVARFRNYLIQQGLRSSTVRSYVTSVEKIWKQEGVFTQESIDAYFLALIQTHSHAGVNRYVKAMKQYCAFLGRPVFTGVKKLKEEPKARILLTGEEIERFIAVSPPPSKYGMFWMLLAFTGARPMEIAQLKTEDVDLTNRCIYFHHTKTHARTAPIDQILKELTEYVSLCSSVYLFPTYLKDAPMSHAAYMKDWKKRLSALGIKKKVQPYSLRHSFITSSLGNEASLFAVQDMVGHTSPETTRKYYHGNIDSMRKAVKRLPLAQDHLTAGEKLQQALEAFSVFHLQEDPAFDRSMLEQRLASLWECIK